MDQRWACLQIQVDLQREQEHLQMLQLQLQLIVELVVKQLHPPSWFLRCQQVLPLLMLGQVPSPL